MTKPLMNFSPVSGVPLTTDRTADAADWRPYAGADPDSFKGCEWRFDPWAGRKRDARDIASDPFGLLIMAPGEQLPPFQVTGTIDYGNGLTETIGRVIPPVVPPTDRRHENRRMPADQDVLVDRRNPKDAAGRAKVPLALLSPIAKAAWAMAQFVGKVKYGAWNWRGTEVLASVYISAAQRHLDAWFSGETYDPDDGTHHLGNVMACAAILLDAAACGKLVDDRPPRVSHRPAYAEAEAIVSPTEAKYAGREVKHWTIADLVAPATLAAPSNQQGENHEPVASRNAPARHADGTGSQGREAGREEA
jgi:hypothetical protein